jgi:glutathionylspermidine synthase
MIRHKITPRSDWKTKANEIGFTFFNDGTGNDGTFWNENVAYEFTSDQVDELDDATEALHAMSLQAVDFIVSNDKLMTNMDIPEKFHDMIKSSWKNKEPTLYGRFDLSYDGKTPPKMLEYNADTPTLVIETSLMQWTWLQQVMPNCDQFNSFHEKMLDRFKYIRTLVPVNETFILLGILI